MQLKNVLFALSFMALVACQSGSHDHASHQENTADHAGHAHHHASAQEEAYPTRGQIASIGEADEDGMVVITVDHEEIPNFMMAMRMGLKAPAADAAQLAAGDKISFKMIQKEDGMAMIDIEKLPADTELKLRAR